jgi:hypothetical protein
MDFRITINLWYYRMRDYTELKLITVPEVDVSSIFACVRFANSSIFIVPRKEVLRVLMGFSW